MPATILSLKMGKTTVINSPYPEVLSGHRCILSVTSIVAKVQTTVLFGNDLFAVGRLSNLDEPTIFKNFLTSYANRSEEWAQLSQVPPPPIPLNLAYLMSASINPIVAPPVSRGKIVLLSAGFDALRGYWIEFAGNYFLEFPLFKDWPNVIRDGPNYKGFQGSQNNPGSNNSESNNC
jgi:hypothetical protein